MYIQFFPLTPNLAGYSSIIRSILWKFEKFSRLLLFWRIKLIKSNLLCNQKKIVKLGFFRHQAGKPNVLFQNEPLLQSAILFLKTLRGKDGLVLAVQDWKLFLYSFNYYTLSALKGFLGRSINR